MSNSSQIASGNHPFYNLHIMKIIYQSYTELLHYAKSALKSTFFGLFRIVWVAFLFIANTFVWAFRKASSAIKNRPMTSLLVFAVLLLTSNSINYISMKAKLNTANWQYDTLRLHTDSIMELYNINKNYSRIMSYE